MSNTSSVEVMERQMEAEFLGETQDTMNALDVLLENLRSHGANPDEALAAFRRAFVNLEARAQAVDQPLVRMVCHRASEYAIDLKTLNDRHIADLQSFVDQVRRMMDGNLGSAAEVAPKLARELPSRTAADFDINDIRQMNIEAMLVIPDKAMSRLIERELVACGYRVNNARTAFRALEHAARTKPDFVIVSAVLDEISGIDVATALVSMPATHRIPTALLTSFGWGHPSLDALPVRVAILRKGPEFGNDLAEFLARFRIT